MVCGVSNWKLKSCFAILKQRKQNAEQSTGQRTRSKLALRQEAEFMDRSNDTGGVARVGDMARLGLTNCQSLISGKLANLCKKSPINDSQLFHAQSHVQKSREERKAL